MSSWTKGQGAKIAIKFTMPLTGNPDICDPDAFSLSAVEPRWTEIPSLDLGPLIDSDIEVQKVEAYPIPIHYEEDFLGGTEVDVEVTESGLILAEAGGA